MNNEWIEYDADRRPDTAYVLIGLVGGLTTILPSSDWEGLRDRLPPHDRDRTILYQPIRISYAEQRRVS